MGDGGWGMGACKGDKYKYPHSLLRESLQVRKEYKKIKSFSAKNSPRLTACFKING